jgi:hypothetical protein
LQPMARWAQSKAFFYEANVCRAGRTGCKDYLATGHG